MRTKKISVTEAAHHFHKCVNRVQSQGIAFVLLKHGKPVARLMPEAEKVCTGRDLAKALAKFTPQRNG